MVIYIIVSLIIRCFLFIILCAILFIIFFVMKDAFYLFGGGSCDDFKGRDFIHIPLSELFLGYHISRPC